jgi:O-antigen/teichoic acid export membrane protein
LSATAGDLVRIFTAPQFHRAAEVTPWIAVGVFFQAIYLIGSIGLVIEKRTAYYPVATGLAAAASVAANLILVPRFGYLGAAWASNVAYATLTALTVTFSQRVYPQSYEWGRILRVLLAAGLAFTAAALLPLDTWPAAVSLAVRGLVVLAVYGGLLAVSGFFHPGELAALGAVRQRVLTGSPRLAGASEPLQVEMAGEIAATETGLASVDTDPRVAGGSNSAGFSGGSRSQPR